MNNEFNQHKKSDFIKWIITFTALILLSISVIALAANVFGGVNNDTTTETEQTTENNQHTTAEGMNTVKVVNSDLMMLSAMAYSSEPTVAGAKATTGVKVTATVLPAGTNQKLNWDISYVDPNNEWAEGVQADASDFVYIESENEDNTVIYVKAYSAFGAQVKITATSAVNPDVSAYILVDYAARLDAEQYLEMGGEGFITSLDSSDCISYAGGINHDGGDITDYIYAPIEFLPSFNYGSITPSCYAEFYVTLSPEFLAALQAEGFTNATGEMVWVGEDVITPAMLINAMVGEKIITDRTACVEVAVATAFNNAAASVGDSLAFTINAMASTDYEAAQFDFDFHFDPDAIVNYVESIEFDVQNIVL